MDSKPTWSYSKQEAATLELSRPHELTKTPAARAGEAGWPQVLCVGANHKKRAETNLDAAGMCVGATSLAGGFLVS